MRRYYPPADASVLLMPTGFALIISVPLLRQASTLVFFALVFVVVFFLALEIWRRFLKVEIDDSLIRGRNPETFKRTELSLSEVTTVGEALFGIGRIKGLSFENAHGKAVFVNKGALSDPRIRGIVDSHSRTML